MVRSGGRRVRPVSLGTLGCALGVVGFICGSWFHWETPSGSSGSSGVAEFTGVRPRGRRINSGNLGSLGCAMGAVGFIRGRWIHRGAPWGSSD